MKNGYRWLWVPLLALALGEGAARAQSDEERAAARAVAQQGLTAWKEGRYAEAVDLLSRAEAVVHAPPHLLYIARAYAKQGKLVKARETYLKLTKEQLAPGAPKPFVDAAAQGAKELAELEPRLPYVKIVVEGPSPPHLRVLVDDAPIAPSLVGVPVPTDPGEHKYQALGEGAESEVSHSTVDEGAQRAVTLTLHSVRGASPSPAAPAVPPAAERPPPTGGDRGSRLATPESDEPGRDAGSAAPNHSLRVLSYVMFGAGAVALGTGAYFQNLRMRREKVSTDHFNECNPRVCTDDEVSSILQLDALANAAQRSANIAFALGGASVALGVTMLILDANQSSRANAPTASRAALRPWIGLGGAGISGTF